MSHKNLPTCGFKQLCPVRDIRQVKLNQMFRAQRSKTCPLYPVTEDPSPSSLGAAWTCKGLVKRNFPIDLSPVVVLDEADALGVD